MERGAAHLIGEHDFKTFAWPLRPSASRPAAMWRRSPLPPRRFWATAPRHHRAGNAFLHSMVRTIVGTLVMVGRGQRDTDWSLRSSLRDRQAAGERPACGLIFWSVGTNLL
ncbi:MAG: hypothetical protein ACLSDQ_06045 [Adlercreutzia equolifaciens]